MQKIPLRLAQPEMTLAKAVLRDNGMVLVAEGTVLTQALLDRLANLNIESVIVDGNPVDLEGAAGSASYAQRIERLDHLFRKHQGDEWMQKVKAFARKHFTLKAAAQSAGQPPDQPPGGGTP